jgi:hypothetical protein
MNYKVRVQNEHGTGRTLYLDSDGFKMFLLRFPNWKVINFRTEK